MTAKLFYGSVFGDLGNKQYIYNGWYLYYSCKKIILSRVYYSTSSVASSYYCTGSSISIFNSFRLAENFIARYFGIYFPGFPFLSVFQCCVLLNFCVLQKVKLPPDLRHVKGFHIFQVLSLLPSGGVLLELGSHDMVVHNLGYNFIFSSEAQL